ncbi:RNA polymerase sigma factor [Kribbella jiaozuonensis]|uniref:RNA polymerase sigma factor n=1 Tax=Kribbella jiaozuonensis TaxID=2575441 RepID=UPI0014852FBF|nr:sigma-70 family RNA polymerase sigma factor [Kribbella jiaozuonensis]
MEASNDTSTSAHDQQRREFEDWLSANYNKLYLVAARRCYGDRDAAVDVLHQALLEIWQRWDRIEHTNSYAYMVIRHAAVQAHRRQQFGWQTIETDSWDIADPVDAVDLAEIRLAAEAILRDLTSREREIVVLLAAGYSIVEIAGRLGKTPSTVRTQLQRIRQKAEDSPSDWRLGREDRS